MLVIPGRYPGTVVVRPSMVSSCRCVCGTRTIPALYTVATGTIYGGNRRYIWQNNTGTIYGGRSTLPALYIAATGTIYPAHCHTGGLSHLSQPIDFTGTMAGNRHYSTCTIEGLLLHIQSKLPYKITLGIFKEYYLGYRNGVAHHRRFA